MLTKTEIAAKLGLPKSRVDSLLYHAKARYFDPGTPGVSRTSRTLFCLDDLLAALSAAARASTEDARG